MTARDAPAPTEAAELADLIVAAVTRCPGVAGLTQIPGIPVATYLPGRTVSGVAVRAGEVEICVVARYGPPLPLIAEQVRQAVAPLVPDRVVDVVIGDIALPDAGPEAGEESAGREQPELSGRPAGVPGSGPGLIIPASVQGPRCRLRQWLATMPGCCPRRNHRATRCAGTGGSRRPGGAVMATRPR